MSVVKPLVLDPSGNGQMEQLQGADELDIPLQERFDHLKHRFDILIAWMQDNDFELPLELLDPENK